MPKSLGRKTWAIPEGYIPEWSHGPAPEFVSHEAFCILNVTDEEARVNLTIYYEEREPVGPYRLTIPARRTKHFRFNDLAEPERIAPGLSYSSVFESNVPVIIQHTRLDSRQAENALMTTIAYAGSE